MTDDMARVQLPEAGRLCTRLNRAALGGAVRAWALSKALYRWKARVVGECAGESMVCDGVGERCRQRAMCASEPILTKDVGVPTAALGTRNKPWFPQARQGRVPSEQAHPLPL
jgi:hypothetical protein